MFQSSCFQLQVFGQGAVTRSNLAHCLNLSKKCIYFSCKSSALMVTSSQYLASNHNQGVCNRRRNFEYYECHSYPCSGMYLQRDREIQSNSRSSVPFKLHRFTFSAAALEGKQLGAEGAKEADEKPNPDPEEIGENNGAWNDESYPSGEFEYKKIEGWSRFVVQLKMFIAPPWERVKKGSVLHMKLRGEILDQLQGSFSSRLSLPKISENFMKAAYDPRIAGIYLEIEPLNCAWGKIDEIRRHILDYKKSGKFIAGYIPVCGEKEYYLACACGELYAPPGAYISLYGLKVQATFLGGVLEKAGITPQIQRIGKYKSAGDLLSRKNISEENREMLTVILDNIYENWVQKISSTLGKTKENIEIFLNEGIYKVERLKQEGWITDIKYDDEVTTMLKERLGQKLDKELLLVDYKKYSKVRKWTLGLAGGRDKIAVIRASGSISRVSSRFNVSRSGIAGEQFIKKIREVRASKRYKAVILRIDSPGGDALASDLMWREIRLLAAEKPVVASMGDVAASGGYYMAMAAGVIVSESLTLTGSIGVVTGKLNLNKLYDRVGFNKEVISRGRFAELDVEQRPFRMVDGDKPAMGYIYEAMDLAKEAIKRRYGDDETKYMPLWDIIDARWDRQLHSPLHAAGYFLNPQYFYDKSKFNEDGEVGRGLMTCLERCFPDPEQQNRVFSQLQDYRTPSKLFAYTSAIRQRSKMLPGLWWQNFGSDTPDLKRFAIRILNQACSASGCERNWSMFEKIHSKKRNRLTQKRLNDLVFVHYNLRLRNKQIQGIDHSPIDLEELDLQATNAAEWVQLDEPPLFSLHDLENFESQASEGAGGIASSSHS